MTPSEPSTTPLDVRGRLRGVPLRITPWFWLAAGALEIRYLADPEAGGFGYFAFGLAAAFVSVLAAALVQALVARAFGVRCGIVLYGFGSLVLGVEVLPRCWQRLLVLLAGPLTSFAILGTIWGLPELFPFPGFVLRWGWQNALATGAIILVQVNAFWGLLNLTPVWPLVGGRSAVDLGETLLGPRGRILALVLSLATVGLLSIGVVLLASARLENRFDPRYSLYLGEGLIQVLFCFLLWIQNFKILWSGLVSSGR